MNGPGSNFAPRVRHVNQVWLCVSVGPIVVVNVTLNVSSLPCEGVIVFKALVGIVADHLRHPSLNHFILNPGNPLRMSVLDALDRPCIVFSVVDVQVHHLAMHLLERVCCRRVLHFKNQRKPRGVLTALVLTVEIARNFDAFGIPPS